MPMSLIKDCYTCFKKITRYDKTVIDYYVFEYNVDNLHLIPILTLAITSVNISILWWILYSYFMPVCSIDKTITLRCRG